MNKNVYYPTYTIDPESIYGSGIVKANKFPTTNTTTSVITDSFPVNKKLSPPVYRSGLALKPLDTNAYRILKDPFGEKYKLDNYSKCNNCYETYCFDHITGIDISPLTLAKFDKIQTSKIAIGRYIHLCGLCKGNKSTNDIQYDIWMKSHN